ncbi:inositol monophosphatase family protein [Streptomyces misionensis]|uniref:inositol monophosphatase family protein n=1 Tax=Streptomyces misionensis TaxID=67331 RepID=UPI0021BD5918|nr:inositol monophosphatase family protein [Streptomyces misionensis]
MTATAFDGFARAWRELEAPVVAVLRDRLSALRPHAGWTEELEGLAALPADGEVWCVDVVDGAVQFIQGLPQFCVSLALVRDGRPTAAVLHAPLFGETYLAAHGHGATRDDRPVRPSAKTDTAATIVATSQPPLIARQPEAAHEAGRSLTAVLPRVGAVRNLGPTSWQIADAAAGRLDAFWQYGRDDTNLLAGALIAEEAGAVVTDMNGEPWSAGADGILVASGHLHGRLLGILTEGGAQRR